MNLLIYVAHFAHFIVVAYTSNTDQVRLFNAFEFVYELSEPQWFESMLADLWSWVNVCTL